MSSTSIPQGANPFDAIVVGAGIAGMYQVYKLRQQGLKVKAFEAGTDVGGTWYWNRYPGARVDSQSEVYQYWFSEELLQEWQWPERFPAQPDVEKYLNYVADKFDLRKDIQFNTRVKSAHFNETTNRWTVTTENGEVYNAQYFMTCAGGLSAPLNAPFKGYETFKGPTFHTARWPKEPIDWKGKRVCVVGTGATAIQVIQTIAPLVDHLTVFQRTANYTIPMFNPKYGPAEQAVVRAKLPKLKEHVHKTFTGFEYDFTDKTWAGSTPAERLALMEELWADGSLAFWIGGYQEVFFDPVINEEISEFVRNKMRARIKDPKMAAMLVPTDHGFGTRRVPLDTGYLEAYNRDNVDLVDVKKEPIVEITEHGIKTRAREYECDILVMAIGFDAGSGALTAMDIRGRGGRVLKDEWKKEIRTTMGLQVVGYPNMFTTMAPFAPAGAFCNMPTCLQQQVDWINDCIRYAKEHGKSVIEPTAEMEEAWLKHHDEVANQTLVVKTKSWYMGSNVEGKPARLLSYLGVGNYRIKCEEVKASGYQGFAMS